jgi:hypothetical protein
MEILQGGIEGKEIYQLVIRATLISKKYVHMRWWVYC